MLTCISVLGMIGVCNMAVLLTVYAPAVKRMGLIRTFQFGILVSFAALAHFPILNVVADNPYLMWPGQWKKDGQSFPWFFFCVCVFFYSN